MLSLALETITRERQLEATGTGEDILKAKKQVQGVRFLRAGACQMKDPWRTPICKYFHSTLFSPWNARVLLKYWRGNFNKHKTIMFIKIRLSHKITIHTVTKMYFNITFFPFLHRVIDKWMFYRSSHHLFYFITF